ncbi:class I SAM-dependent methyltransferase [Dermacoccus nishinomiyaensis]|uniref:class I SAM-dependent methyltransferase n=1 Tax=Dermacoccus nishinomiyaensis TaxID=1274 RepID=UPI0013F3AB07|nr:class I SAM-dependent methyltransferase [Dermacoccus nishinomiyaensis]NHC30941.1 class I SAM-dependent methyltransferase [Dermacoccus nishinomiyaensis]
MTVPTRESRRENPSWAEWVSEDPTRSQWYVDRIRAMAARGDDLGGEARLVNALVTPGSRILDAGCGPGRVAAALSALGHDVVGVDLDPVLIAAAREDHPSLRFEVVDLARLSLDDLDVTPLDAIVCAGNVMPFMPDDARRDGLAAMRQCVRDGGRLAVGFGAGRGYTFEQFFDDADAVGWRLDARFSTWEMHSPAHDDGFVVAVFTAVAPR